ncbi:MAG: hypothetical protein IKD27_09000 [Oscillospiraceae bacterium]|nr:hypothetical protein [Oscillospiraceae bacterium]
MRQKSRQMAFGGMLTAVSVVIMALGSIIPLNTYTCPVLCIFLTRPVLERCGKTVGWCYYLAVMILSLLLAPDREAALVYAFLGYYPMVKPWFEKLGPVKTAAKLTFFTAMGAASYWMLLLVMGAEAAMGEGWLMTAVTVILWDVLFMRLDWMLGAPVRKKR